MTPHPSTSALSRRNVLRAGGLVLVTASASSCGFFSGDDEDDRAGGDKGREAPMLAERVEAGTLDAVDQRLPRNPLVVPVTDRFGVYGGTWRTATTGVGDGPWLHRTIGYEGLMRWTPDWSGTLINVAESITPSDDAREFTVKLREGHRWSDGAPLTTRDVEFAYEVLTDPELNQIVHQMLQAGGENAELQIVDDYTFVVRFAVPNGLWITNNARQVDGDRFISFPRHYLEQFLPQYNDQAEANAQAAGFETWQEYFNNLGNGFSVAWSNVDLPTLKPWIAIEPLNDAATQAVFERNPYYFKVDEEGSQLPYLDRVQYDVISDVEAILLRATAGELDFHTRHFNTLDNQPVVVESQETGGYGVLPLQNTLQNEMTIMLNLHHRDEAVRELYQQKDFRVALSHAINRERLINAVWNRQGIPHQAAPVNGSTFYDAEMATQYLEYDTDTADQLLDGLGLDERDGAGFRLRPDGERVSVRVSIAEDGPNPLWVNGMELVAEDWEAVGVECVLDPKTRDAWTAEKDERDQDATVWLGEGGHNDAIFLPRQYFAFDFESHFGNSWATQWRGGTFEDEDDVPPPMPDAMAQQQQLYDQFTAEVDEAARDEIFRQILQIAKEQFWCIGTVKVESGYGIAHNRMQNVGDGMPENSTFNTPAPANPEQFFIDESAA